MKQINQNKLILGIASVVLGILFIIMKGGVISLAMTVVGVLLIVSGVMDIIKKRERDGIIKVAAAAVIIIFGWALVSIALYVAAALLMVSCIFVIYRLVVSRVKIIASYIQPSLMLVISLLLLFNQGGTVNSVFIISGIILIIDGAFILADTLLKK